MSKNMNNCAKRTIAGILAAITVMTATVPFFAGAEESTAEQEISVIRMENETESVTETCPETDLTDAEYEELAKIMLPLLTEPAYEDVTEPLTEEEAAVETMTEAMTYVPQAPVPVDREAFRSRVLDNITDQSYLDLYNVWMQHIQ